MKRTALLIILLVISISSISAQSFQSAFESIRGNGHFRSLGRISPDTEHYAIYRFGLERYMNRNFINSDGYSSVIRGRVRYASNIINIPTAMLTAMENKLKTLTITGGDMFEFIFSYEKDRFARGYVLVLIYAQETWGYFDCAQAWFICTE